MKDKLKKLAQEIKQWDLERCYQIEKLAGRYDKAISPPPEGLQHCIKYIIYLKLMRNLDDASFHALKRKYRDTKTEIQLECQKELDKLILEDAIKQKIPSSTIRREFQDRFEKYFPTYIKEDS
jgi:hypothetical protein